MDIFLTRTVSGLAPADDAAKDALRKLKIGKAVRANISVPRNIAHHRKYFALLNTVWAATDAWPSPEDLNIELKIRLGITRDVIVRSTGEVVKIIGSINFASMDQAAFDQFYNRALRELCQIAGGIEFEALRDEVLSQLAAA